MLSKAATLILSRNVFKRPYPVTILSFSSRKFSSNHDEKQSDSSSKAAGVILGSLVVGGIGAYAYTRSSSDGSKSSGEKKNTPTDNDPPWLHSANSVIKSPIQDIPSHVPFLIIGGGVAGLAATRSIRGSDPRAKVLMVTEEGYNPYLRPPLSKELWHNSDVSLTDKLNFLSWSSKSKTIFLEPDEYYLPYSQLATSENGGVSVLKNVRVERLLAHKNKAILSTGQEITFEKCLIATGGKPRQLPIFSNASAKVQKKIVYFKTAKDFSHLEKLLRTGPKKVAIVGGGFLGSELSCAIASKAKQISGSEVTLIFPEPGCLDAILPTYLSKWTTKKIENEGVTIMPNAMVTGVQSSRNGVKLQLSDASREVTSEKEVDLVVCCVGFEPDTSLGQASGLEIDPVNGGFLVNAELQARSNVWVAGDAASFFDIKLGRRRVEHHDHAVVSGRLAGANMTSSHDAKPYWHQSMFWSDLGPNIGFEALGVVDSSLNTQSFFALSEEESGGDGDRKKNGSDFSRGVVFYTRDDIIVGVLMWNIFGRMGIARQLLKRQDKMTPESLEKAAKLFKLHGEAEPDDSLPDKDASNQPQATQVQ